MLVSLHTPDEIFQDIVAEALESAIVDLSTTSTDREMYRQLFPHTSQYVEGRTALELLHSLQRCNLSPEWYDLQSLHRVLLSAALRRYCARYNAQPQSMRLHAKYELYR